MAGFGLPTAAADPHWSKSAEGKGKPDLFISKSYKEGHSQKCNECRKEKEGKDKSKNSVQGESSDMNTDPAPLASATAVPAIAFVPVNVNDVFGASGGNGIAGFFPVEAFPVFYPVEAFPVFYPVEAFPVSYPVGDFPGFYPVGDFPVTGTVGGAPGFYPVGDPPVTGTAGGAPRPNGTRGVPGLPNTGSDPGGNPLP